MHGGEAGGRDGEPRIEAKCAAALPRAYLAGGVPEIDRGEIGIPILVL